jgi:hypothetical protein
MMPNKTADSMPITASKGIRSVRKSGTMAGNSATDILAGAAIRFIHIGAGIEGALLRKLAEELAQGFHHIGQAICWPQ